MKQAEKQHRNAESAKSGIFSRITRFADDGLPKRFSGQ
jgi:hypothetical protein